MLKEKLTELIEWLKDEKMYQFAARAEKALYLLESDKFKAVVGAITEDDLSNEEIASIGLLAILMG